jgi:hypothetical protein
MFLPPLDSHTELGDALEIHRTKVTNFKDQAHESITIDTNWPIRLVLPFLPFQQFSV